MMKPKRIQRKRTRGWRMPKDTVYVGRPSKWGNPFWIGNQHGLTTIEQCIAAYEIATAVKIEQGWLDISELRGKNLACWCQLDKPCHADVLLELANEKRKNKKLQATAQPTE